MPGPRQPTDLVKAREKSIFPDGGGPAQGPGGPCAAAGPGGAAPVAGEEVPR